MDTLALTDRDGVYGAVKFARACRSAGIRPVLGVDLAVEPSGLLSGAHPSLRAPAPRRATARAGPHGRRPPGAGAARAGRRLRRPPAPAGHPARPGQAGLGGAVPAGLRHPPARRAGPAGHDPRPGGRARAGGRGAGRTAGAARLLVLLGPTSEVGRALTARRPDLARAVLARWREVVDRADLLLEVVSHRGPDDLPRAARMLRLATEERLTAVLTNAVRYADRADAPIVDVLDASRRLVALDPRHVDRVNAEGYLKSGKEMAQVAEEVAAAAGLDTRAHAGGCSRRPGGWPTAAPSTRAPTSGWARCTSPTSERRRPERGTSGAECDRCDRCERRRRQGRDRAGDAAGPVRGGARPAGDARDPRGAGAARRRAGGHRDAGLPVVLPHRRRRRRPHPRHGGARRGPRVRRGQPGQLPARRLGRRPDAPRPAHGAVPLAAARGAARRGRRRRVRAPHRGLRAHPRPLRRRAGGLRLDDGHLPRAPRGPRRRGGARHAARRDRPDRQGLPAHPGPRRAPGARGAARAAGVPAGAGRPGLPRPAVPAGGPPRRAATARRAAPVRGAALRHHPARPHPGRGELAGLPDEPVRQGRRRGARPAQARRARHPHAVRDVLRRRRGGARRRGGPDRPGRRDPGALRRPRHVRPHPVHPHPRHVPDRVAGPA